MKNNILGWIGNLGFLLGALLLANKNLYGFHAQIIANLLYAYQAILMKNQPLFWLSIILTFINCYGIIIWVN